jgi:hypothetical protein
MIGSGSAAKADRTLVFLYPGKSVAPVFRPIPCIDGGLLQNCGGL